MRLIGAAALAAVLCAAPARAAEYETFIDIASEDELYDLFQTEQISEDTFNTLVELYRRGLDLNRASREELYQLPNLSYREVDAIIAYREDAGHIADPATLVVVGALSERQLLAIAPFLIVRAQDPGELDLDGFIRAPMVWAADTDGPPPGALQARVAVEDFTFGIAGFVTHTRVSDVRYDPGRMALSAEAPEASIHLPKLFAQWQTDDYEVIAGTYRIGFGQRLTFDNTDRYTPSGFYFDDTVFRGTGLSRECKESAGELPSPCTGDARYRYLSPDYRWRESLRGVAAGANEIELGTGWLQAYGFASYETKSIYQYEVYDRAACADPRDDDDPACAAPDVYRRQDDLLSPTTEIAFQTLPDMFAETIVGGNVTYFADHRARAGVTAYGADINWLVEGVDLDFQEWSRYPFGGNFGAVGIDGGWGKGRTDLYAEVTRSFDSQPGSGGDFAGLLRVVTGLPNAEVEGSLRYYGADYANPYARPISQPDEQDGLRARDETGMRVRYTGEVDDLHLRAQTDFWLRASDGSIPQNETLLRADYELDARHRPGMWVLYRNKDLSDNGFGQCFEISDEVDDFGERIPCGGQKIQTALRYRYQPRRRLSLSTQLQLEWLDDTGEEFEDELRKDVSLWGIVNTWPRDDLRLRGRVRYQYEDVCYFGDEASDMGPARSAGGCLSDLVTGGPDDTRERSLWTYIDATYQYVQNWRMGVRYDLVVRIDDRESTELRDPNPEHWFWLELEARF